MVHRVRRCPNAMPALGQCLVFAGKSALYCEDDTGAVTACFSRPAGRQVVKRVPVIIHKYGARITTNLQTSHLPPMIYTNNNHIYLPFLA